MLVVPLVSVVPPVPMPMRVASLVSVSRVVTAPMVWVPPIPTRVVVVSPVTMTVSTIVVRVMVRMLSVPLPAVLLLHPAAAVVPVVPVAIVCIHVLVTTRRHRIVRVISVVITPAPLPVSMPVPSLLLVLPPMSIRRVLRVIQSKRATPLVGQAPVLPVRVPAVAATIGVAIGIIGIRLSLLI